MTLPARLDANFMAVDGLATPDLFVLWALRQRLAETDECGGRVSQGFRRVLGEGNGVRPSLPLKRPTESSPTMGCGT